MLRSQVHGEQNLWNYVELDVYPLATNFNNKPCQFLIIKVNIYLSLIALHPSKHFFSFSWVRNPLSLVDSWLKSPLYLLRHSFCGV